MTKEEKKQRRRDLAMLVICISSYVFTAVILSFIVIFLFDIFLDSTIEKTVSIKHEIPIIEKDNVHKEINEQNRLIRTLSFNDRVQKLIDNECYDEKIRQQLFDLYMREVGWKY